MPFDREGALKEGYTEQEINDYLGSKPQYDIPSSQDSSWEKIKKNAGNFYRNLANPAEIPQAESPAISPKLTQQHPNFDVQGALDEGYTPEEIEDYLISKKPKRSKLEKAGRVAGGFGLSLLEGTPPGMIYDLSTLPLSSKSVQQIPYRQALGDELESLMEKQSAGQWDEQDQERYNQISAELQNPELSEPFIKTDDLSLRGLTEKATGVDLHPEDYTEKFSNFLGWLKSPRGYLESGAKKILTPKNLLNSMRPGAKTVEALGGAAGWEMAEEGNFGPVSSLAAIVAGHLSTKALISPKKTVANILNFATRANSKKAISNSIAEEAKNIGLQLDAGSLTNSDFVRMVQARAAQSSLTGQALENFIKDQANVILKEYEGVANTVGELSIESNHQAADSIKEALRVEEMELPFFKDQKQSARPLEGRIQTHPAPLHEQELLQNISPTEFTNDAEAGQSLQRTVREIKEPIQEEFNQRWSEFNERTENIEGPQAELASELQRFVEENKGSLLLGESTAENRTLQAAQRLLDMLVVDGSLRGVSLKELIQTKRTLGDVADWEIGKSDFSSRFKKIYGDIDSAIQRTLERQSPELLQEFQNLNSEYSSFKNIFENDNVVSLFERNNRNYNSMYKSFVSNPDSMYALEDILHMTKEGGDLLNQVKRDYAQRVLSRANVLDKDIRNLANVLGEDFQQPLADYMHQREYYQQHPLPHAMQQPRLGISAEAPRTTSNYRLSGKNIKESNVSLRKKMYDSLIGKSSEQIMNQMNTVSGIRKLGAVLNTTEQGRELFKKLKRFKLEELIGNKMKDSLNGNLKSGTFSGLLKTNESRQLVKELVGEEAFKKLRNLQKLSNVMDKSLTKFYNYSQSGTSLADMAVVSTLVSSIISGNPFFIAKAMAVPGIMKIGSYLLSDPEFLKYLQEAATSTSKAKSNTTMLKYLKKMEPAYARAVNETSED